VYADAIYPNGIKVSSLPVRAIPKRIGIKEANDHVSEVLADFSLSADGWYYYPGMRTEPINAEFRYEFITDPAGGRGMVLPDHQGIFRWGTYKCVDPKWRPDRDHSGLKFRFYAAAEGEWTCITVFRPWMGGQRKWEYTTHLVQGWHWIQVPIYALLDDTHTPIPSIQLIHQLIVTFKENPVKNGGSALGSVTWT